MSIFEFDEEREMKLIREAKYQYGHEQGKKEGIIVSVQRMLKKGYSKEQIINLEYTEEEIQEAEKQLQ